MPKVCVIAYLFLLTKDDIIVYYNKFPNLGVTALIFPISKVLGPLSKIAKENPWAYSLQPCAPTLNIVALVN